MNQQNLNPNLVRIRYMNSYKKCHMSPVLSARTEKTKHKLSKFIRIFETTEKMIEKRSRSPEKLRS